MKALQDSHIAVIGLGYVGAPLALALAKHGRVTGMDINAKRVEELAHGHDANREIAEKDLKTTSCVFTAKAGDIQSADIYIVTVPTPIDDNKQPDLTAVKSASKTIGAALKKGDIVVYESTVYPGVTEDVCGPILARESGLVCGTDFFLGYSPERINPGDLEHTVENITKIVAGQTPKVTDLLAELYGRMNGGKIFKARNIKTAEAAKAIENAQRDINIAFINEVTMLLNKLDLSALDVLEAARTKWNFLNFVPGLVGGHCIGVDPYYLAKSALDAGHTPEVILAGRKINDSMGEYLAKRLCGFLNKNKPADILLLGFTFKENINDIRNSKVIDIVNALRAAGHRVDVHDPHALPEEVEKEYGLPLLTALPRGKTYDCVAPVVAHTAYKAMQAGDVAALLKKDALVYDIKGIWKNLDLPGVSYKSL